MSLWPQTLVNVKVQAGFDWQKNTKLIQAKEQAEKKLANEGRVLIRASGTEPLIRVMVEARDAELARTLAEEIAAQVQA
jgi:phosphoglucosamine mutase